LSFLSCIHVDPLRTFYQPEQTGLKLKLNLINLVNTRKSDSNKTGHNPRDLLYGIRNYHLLKWITPLNSRLFLMLSSLSR